MKNMSMIQSSYTGIPSNVLQNVSNKSQKGQDNLLNKSQANKNQISSNGHHSKQKIKLVSPFKNNKKLFQTMHHSPMKQNLSQLHASSKKPKQPGFQLSPKNMQEIPQKVMIKQSYQSGISTPQNYNHYQKPSLNLSKEIQNKMFHKKNAPSFNEPLEPQKIVSCVPVKRNSSPRNSKTSHLETVKSLQRAKSPQRIIINNKEFNLNNLKSHIVYVKPILHTKTLSTPPYTPQTPPNFTLSILRQEKPTTQNHHPNNNWPTDLLIQQQNNLELIKQSYQSEIQDILHLKQEIELNNVQIKELLHTSRLSKELDGDRFASDYIKEGENVFNQSIIYKSDIMNEKVLALKKKKIYIQTDLFNSKVALLEKQSSTSQRSSTLSFIKNTQCEMNLILNICKPDNTHRSLQQQSQTYNKQITFANESRLSHKNKRVQKMKTQTEQDLQIYSNYPEINILKKSSKQSVKMYTEKKSQEMLLEMSQKNNQSLLIEHYTPGNLDYYNNQHNQGGNYMSQYSQSLLLDQQTHSNTWKIQQLMEKPIESKGFLAKVQSSVSFNRILSKQNIEYKPKQAQITTKQKIRNIVSPKKDSKTETLANITNKKEATIKESTSKKSISSKENINKTQMPSKDSLSLLEGTKNTQQGAKKRIHNSIYL